MVDTEMWVSFFIKRSTIIAKYCSDTNEWDAGVFKYLPVHIDHWAPIQNQVTRSSLNVLIKIPESFLEQAKCQRGVYATKLRIEMDHRE